MASQKPPLTIIHSPAAINELGEIWRWNAERYGVSHADAYLGFLKQHIDSLSSHYAKGKTVSSRPDLHYILIRRRAKGHDHLAVYSYNDNHVRILHVFHTAQDWQNQLTA